MLCTQPISCCLRQFAPPHTCTKQDIYLALPDVCNQSLAASPRLAVMTRSKWQQLLAITVAVVVHLGIVTGQTNVCTAPPQIPEAARKLQQFAAEGLLAPLFIIISAKRTLSSFIPCRPECVTAL